MIPCCLRSDVAGKLQGTFQAIIQPRSATEITDQMQSGIGVFRRLQRIEEKLVTDIVLGNGHWPERVGNEARVTLDSKKRSQVLHGLLDQFVCREFTVFRLLDSPDETHEGNLAVRGTAREEGG